MNDLSIVRVQEELDTDTTRSDVTTTFLKVLASRVPKVGPVLAHIIGVVIPNEKLTRLIIFTKVLGDRIRYIEDEMAKQRMETPEFMDLFEEALLQASRALTDDRRQYIAALLANSIASEGLQHSEEKKLLWLLGELNDAEILTLKFYSLSLRDKQSFAALHKELFAPVDRSLDVQDIIDKRAFRNSYRSRLLELNLLEGVYKKAEVGTVPEFDLRTGRIKASDYNVTSLGKLFLRYIDRDVEKARGPA